MIDNKRSVFFVQGKILLLCCQLLPAAALSNPPIQSPHPPSFALNSVLSFNKHPLLSKPAHETEHNALLKLYSLSPRPLLWIPGNNLKSTSVDQVFHLLETAPDSGLPISPYEADRLKTKWRQLQNKEFVNDYELTLFDTALSITTLRYLSDLRHGRINRQSDRFGFWQKTDYDLLARLILNAIQTGRIDRLTEQVEPDLPAYRQLKKALHDYRELTRNYLFPTLLFKDSVKLGDRDPQIAILRRKLNALGLLSPHSDQSQEEIYQSEMLEAVKHYQRLRGLNDDGIIGKKTLAALNTPLLDRVRQIELALERLRWLPPLNKDQALILVNIPAFRLWAYQSGDMQGDSELSMKVVVGIARKNQTPVFMADLVYLEFKPYWNVPKKITLEEILPSLVENPDYLTQQNMELVQYFSSYAEPQPFNQDSLELLQKGVIKIRQRPGPKNSLGLVKFIFPNQFGVYLHDTPARKLFLSERRDYSHGCIRVEQPQALAEFVLQSRKEWPAIQIKEAMQAGENQRVFVKEAIAVLIFYSTAMAIDNEIYFYDDIYRYDERLSQALYPATVS